jgi:hypothetical protein
MLDAQSHFLHCNHIESNGTFSFDDSIIPLGGGSISETGLLTDLDFI